MTLEAHRKLVRERIARLIEETPDESDILDLLQPLAAELGADFAYCRFELGYQLGLHTLSEEEVDGTEPPIPFSPRVFACKRGHPLSGDNLLVLKRGERRCRECAKIHRRTRYEKNKHATAV